MLWVQSVPGRSLCYTRVAKALSSNKSHYSDGFFLKSHEQYSDTLQSKVGWQQRAVAYVQIHFLAMTC